MGTLELKANIHNIVESIQNEQLLQAVYDFLKLKENTQTGKIWNSVSQAERDEVLLAYEESKDKSNVIPISELFKREE